MVSVQRLNTSPLKMNTRHVMKDVDLFVLVDRIHSIIGNSITDLRYSYIGFKKTVNAAQAQFVETEYSRDTPNAVVTSECQP